MLVRFAADTTATVLDSGATFIQAKVPAGAVSGPIVVEVDGLSATGSPRFEVLKSLALAPAVTTDIASGTAVPFTLGGKDTADAAVTGASASLSFIELRPADVAASLYVATLSGTVFTPLSTGSWEIRADSGTVRATASVTTR